MFAALLILSPTIMVRDLTGIVNGKGHPSPHKVYIY